MWVNEHETRAKIIDRFNIMVHVLTETNQHAGHADILREQLDGQLDTDSQSTALQKHGAAHWDAYRAKIEQAARAADPRA